MVTFSRIKNYVELGSPEIMYLAYLTLYMMMNSVVAVSDLTLANSDTCNHLILSEGQKYNAFYFHERLCCLCDKGTKLTEPCNSTHSTVCDPCDDGEYQDFTAHKEPDCRLQIKINCFHPRVLSKGSKTKPDKCVCMIGFEEKLGICFPVSASPTATSLMSIITSKVLQNMSSTKSTVTPTDPPETNPSSTSTDKSATVESTTTVFADSQTTVVDAPEILHNNGKTDSSVTGQLSLVTIGWFAGLLIAVLIAVIIAVVIVISRRKKKQSGKAETDSADVAYTADPVNESSRTLLKGRKRTTSSSSITCCNIQTSMEEIAAPNKAGPEHRGGVVAEAYGNGSENIPSYPEQQMLLGAAAENETVVNTDRNVPAAEVYLHRVLAPGKMNEFVRELASQWASPPGQHVYIGYNNVNPVFRSLFRTNHDAVIDSAQIEYKGNLQEMLYQLLCGVQRNLGRDFTPYYVIGKLRGMNPLHSNLIDITKDVVKKLTDPPGARAENNTA